VLLRVELEPFGVDLTVHVNCKGGNPQERAPKVDESRAAIGEQYTPGNRKITIEPGMQQNPAIRLHPELPIARLLQLRVGLDPQVGRIAVRADQMKPGLAWRRSSEMKRGKGSAAAHQVHFVPGAHVPRLRFVESAVAVRLQSLRGLGNRVKRGRGGVDVLE
jgi:hypothetical protein